MKKYLDINPAKTLGAIAVFVQAVVTLLALRYGWDANTVLAVDGSTTAFLGVVGSLFVGAKTVSTAALEEYAAAVKALEEVALKNLPKDAPKV